MGLRAYLSRLDWLLVGASLLISLAGLITMQSHNPESQYFERQLVWIVMSFCAMVLPASLDVRFLRRTNVLVSLYLLVLTLLVLVLFFGEMTLGARNRFDLGILSFQPADLAQFVLVLVLAKYFSRRHVEIAHIRHILVSGTYMLLFFVLLFLEPDFGSAVIIAAIWFSMVLVSGISKKHLVLVFLVAGLAGSVLWFAAFEEYQKTRIMTFLNPLADTQGAGYNALQSVIAVGSGGLTGKGIGYGSQSKLDFLPEFETDFIFAAFVEEWGVLGTLVLLLLFGILIWRTLSIARFGATNFETLTALGVLAWFMAHASIHIGMNVGVLPVTGTTMPLMSYGGSHLLTEYFALGLLMGMRRYGRTVERAKAEEEPYLT